MSYHEDDWRKAVLPLGTTTKFGKVVAARFDANWDYYGKSAGPLRNRWMLSFGKPELVLAFHSDLQNSKGTKDMVDWAKRNDVEVRIIQ